MTDFPDVETMLSSLEPTRPVYCVHGGLYAAAASEFLDGFPGRVLYAVKANNDPAVVAALHAAGIRHFDCASLEEIELVRSVCADSVNYFMNPVRLPGAARDAFRHHGVQHFMVDHAAALPALVAEIEPSDCVIFARMAVSHASAAQDLSAKFGAPPDDIPDLLDAIRASGAEPALAFNVGSGVRSPDGYRHAIGVAAKALGRLPFRVRLVDIGGGFPRRYPGFVVPPLGDFFAAIRESAAGLPLADNGELLAEPGRALAAPGLSAVVRVLARKGDVLYINDGMYGAFWELRFEGHKQYPVRVLREGADPGAGTAAFTIYGPTCDSTDRLPQPVVLPTDIRVGDYLEFASIGAYSLSGRTDFNGFFSDTVVTIDNGWRDAR